MSKYVYFSNQIRTGPDAILCNKVGGGAGIVSWFCYFLYGSAVQWIGRVGGGGCLSSSFPSPRAVSISS